MERFYITTPIYYVNAKPHLGHAYTTTVADSLNRFHKLMGEETYFLTGTDEHGDKIVQAAESNGQTPQEYVDVISKLFEDLWPGMNISNNDFIRTTQSRHITVVQDILQKVHDAGDIYFGEYGGHYCFGCERFYTEKELVDGLCPDHQTKPEYIAEKNYFFKMSKYRDWLLDHIKKHPDFIRPEQYRNEVVSLLESGELEDLCISRPKSRLTWGIELPFDADYVTYVWFDALINYVAALGYPSGDKFKKFWPAANHLVAKDILKPHAVFWPTMLKAAGIEPYQHLNVHGYWLVADTKMSKSIGNVVEPLAMKDAYGLDPFRYFLLREMSFGQDSSFSEKALVGRLNADLANDLGNLFNRTLSMTHKYFNGVIPGPDIEDIVDAEIKKVGQDAMKSFQGFYSELKFSRALEGLWELVRGLNKYIDATAPWTLYKEKNTGRLSTVIYVLLENMRKIAVHLWPVMPESSEQMLKQLSITFDPEKVNLPKELDVWGLLESGQSVAETSNLFPRVDMPEEETPKKEKPAKKAEASGKEAVPTIEFEDFQKLDLRVGTVMEVEKHPEADRLLLVRVDTGDAEPRQVVAGIADFFSPDDLIGKQVVVVTNLKPRKLRKQLSQGMILAVKTADGMQLLTPTGEVDPGSKVS
ncbi:MULTISPECIES: methionine--tRNA ligase [unclassified Pseudodesulfovibrio]|uniref:methionine--tRNA ligase n=1 Tax=unclassified Pseudodesulfovibrio TaxID=2661612 RepID=UPI000FEBC50D|nr:MULTISPECIES: methionine--tRNA ligase [unclassified Pseudodesulfovibrio]MCJ2164968.1 methionine--tRNA ligase [Pseudodesulfovibrio sp. S3-i]RWU03588.1 methionine--tRNA ligase [Pseudodesulfovibrio sp. S3]